MLEPSFNYNGSFLLSAVHSIQQQDNTAGGPYDELQLLTWTGYLDNPGS